jgi:hypothetical protein
MRDRLDGRRIFATAQANETVLPMTPGRHRISAAGARPVASRTVKVVIGEPATVFPPMQNRQCVNAK